MERLLALLFVLFFGGFCGCASHQVKPMSVRPIDTYPSCVQKESIWLAAEAYDNSEKAKDMFYLDVTSKGFYPVMVVIRNNGNDNILILRETAELECGGTIYRPVRSAVMYNDFERNKMAYALLGFGIFSYMSAEEANRKMETDWREKELPDQLIVSPGRMANGMLYFKLPTGLTLSGARLRLMAEKTGNRQQVPLVLDLH